MLFKSPTQREIMQVGTTQNAKDLAVKIQSVNKFRKSPLEVADWFLTKRAA